MVRLVRVWSNPCPRFGLGPDERSACVQDPKIESAQHTFGASCESRAYTLCSAFRATQSYRYVERAVTKLANAATNSRVATVARGLPVHCLQWLKLLRDGRLRHPSRPPPRLTMVRPWSNDMVKPWSNHGPHLAPWPPPSTRPLLLPPTRIMGCGVTRMHKGGPPTDPTNRVGRMRSDSDAE